ncbi:MAG: TonB-dependent receptor [Deltaproteobacteria bacterium]|jgi:hypothetical protein|nr:TonB-dependent receptor [Deltaproteobacteria bacterium]
MKKFTVSILVLLGLLVSQTAAAWEWPFFGQKKEVQPEHAPVSLQAPENNSPTQDHFNQQPLTEERLKFVVRSYAQTYDFHGDQSHAVFDSQILNTPAQSAGQSAGLSYSPTDYLNLHAEYSGLIQTQSGSLNINPTQNQALGTGFSLGYEFDFGDLDTGLKYFDFDYRRQLYDTSPSGRKFNVPEDTARYRGLEFSVEWQMDETFDWDFELRPYFTLIRLFEKWTPRTAFSHNDSDLRFSYGLVFNHEKLGLSMSLEANRGRRTPFFFYGFDGTGFSDSTVYDFHLAKRLFDWKDNGRLLLKADVTNIGDTPSDNRRNKNEEGRTFKTGLRYEY